jgi:hypothetical protein
VWRAGRVASTIRLQALLALNAMFARGLLAPAALDHATLLPCLLPLLTTSLDDFDARIRMQAIKSMRHFLATTEAVIDGTGVQCWC